MHLRIQVAGLSKAAQLRRYAVHKLKAAIAWFNHSIQEANVRVKEISGLDRGNVDKLFRLFLRVKGRLIVAIEELGSGGYEVINQAINCLRQCVSRQMFHVDEIDPYGVSRCKLLAVNV